MFELPDIVRKVRLGEPLPLHWDLLLRAATPITRMGMVHRLHKTSATVNVPVIAFGNLTVGGTGKTPAVIERITRETAQGHRVAVVTRGYGSERVPEPFLASTELSTADMVRLVGDEPALIRRYAPDTLIIKSAQRFDGARMAVEEHGATLVILDDGYQHVALARNENICLIDATNPFGNGQLIPRGILREPLSALSRATQIILTRCDQAQNLQELRVRLAELAPDIPVRETVHAPGRFWNVRSGVSVSALDGNPVTAVCGIGNPEAFFRTLDDLGIELADRLSYGDHAKIPAEALARPGLIVTTEKDAMRLVDPPETVYALEVTLKDWTEG